MIEDLKPKPLSDYNNSNLSNKQDCVKIVRKGTAPKGKYCTGCTYFSTQLVPKINPWNDSVDMMEHVSKCLFFDEPLLLKEEYETPCNMQGYRYIKCLSCLFQEVGGSNVY